jgi:hypothetical protein
MLERAAAVALGQEQSAYAPGARHRSGDALHDGPRLQARVVKDPPGRAAKTTL